MFLAAQTQNSNRTQKMHFVEQRKNVCQCWSFGEDGAIFNKNKQKIQSYSEQEKVRYKVNKPAQFYMGSSTFWGAYSLHTPICCPKDWTETLSPIIEMLHHVNKKAQTREYLGKSKKVNLRAQTQRACKGWAEAITLKSHHCGVTPCK